MTWPPVFDGVGALVVRCDLDPAALVAKIPGLTWIAPKVNGADITPRADIEHAVTVWKSLGLHVGSWIYNDGPPQDDVPASYPAWYVPEFVVYDVETPYKADEGGHYEWAAQLVTRHHDFYLGKMPAAVTSYGAYKNTIDFGAFASAGWPVLAQLYDSFVIGDEVSYYNGGPYTHDGVHQMIRSLTLTKAQAVYRPEGIDG